MPSKSKLIDAKLAGEDYCYITTTGRVSGKPHTIEIWFGTEGNTIYVLAGSRHDADFVKNAKKQPAVDVRIGPAKFAGTARIVSEVKEDALARKLLLDKYVKVETSDLTEWGRDALPVAFDLARP
jgi:deazaflavin-dependent oxidoreductase (nitroreductase family)